VRILNALQERSLSVAQVRACSPTAPATLKLLVEAGLGGGDGYCCIGWQLYGSTRSTG